MSTRRVIRPRSNTRARQRRLASNKDKVKLALSLLDNVVIKEELNPKKQARVVIDEGKIHAIDEDPSSSGSTYCSVCGTLAVFLVSLMLVYMVIDRYEAREPSINQIVLESENPVLKVPDVALTYNLNSENAEKYGITDSSDLLDYFWPKLTWEIREDAFNSGPKSILPMGAADGARLGGDACGLESVKGNAWPVVCLLDAPDAYELQGRYGDPVYAVFVMKIFACNQSAADVVLDSPFQEQWSGNCASDQNITSLVDSWTSFNLWFRFMREDWDNHETLQPPSGTGSKDWTWYDYGILESGMEFKLKLSLQYNKASVHKSSESVFGTATQYEYFSFEATDTKEQDDASDDDPLANIEVRISPYPVSSSITVNYMNWQVGRESCASGSSLRSTVSHSVTVLPTGRKC